MSQSLPFDLVWRLSRLHAANTYSNLHQVDSGIVLEPLGAKMVSVLVTIELRVQLARPMAGRCAIEQTDLRFSTKKDRILRTI